MFLMEFNQLSLVQAKRQLRGTFMELLTSALKAFQIIEMDKALLRSIAILIQEMQEHNPWLLISLPLVMSSKM
jgi:hypothetical protein